MKCENHKLIVYTMLVQSTDKEKQLSPASQSPPKQIAMDNYIW